MQNWFQDHDQVVLQTRTQLKVSWWPLPQDYNESIQNPHINLSDTELQSGLVYTDRLGLPRPVTGSFASVYRLKCEQRDVAVRCFLRNATELDNRYAVISEFLHQNGLSYTVSFDYLARGIQVADGQWLPILKMAWIDGDSLDQYVVQNISKPDRLARLAEKFLKMMRELRRVGIAHGDLQHGNIIVCGDELRLVDYDGMFVPSMKGFKSAELGHRNYQHPQRDSTHFGPYLDNFSAWIIYASLRAVEKDPLLLHQLGGGDDCLLFRHSDYLDPQQSSAFSAFEHHKDSELNALGRFIRYQLSRDPAVIPFLELPVPVVPSGTLEKISTDLPPVRHGARLVRGTLPDWLDQDAVAALSLGRFDHSTESVAAISPEKLQTKSSWAVPVRQSAVTNWAPPVVSTKTAIQARQTIPAELLIPPKRRVSYNGRCGHTNPMRWQLAVLPVWLFCCSALFSAFGPDDDLRLNGEDYTAKIISISHDEQSRGTYSTVFYSYEVNRDPYGGTLRVEDISSRWRVGDVATIRALPSNPNFSEGLDQPAGSRKDHDLAVGFGLLPICLLLEFAMWRIPLWQRLMAEYAEAGLATVVSLQTVQPPQRRVRHYAYLKYRGIDRRIAVNLREMNLLRVGTSEVVLFDPTLGIVLYRFCRYQPVSTSSQP